MPIESLEEFDKALLLWVEGDLQEHIIWEMNEILEKKTLKMMSRKGIKNTFSLKVISCHYIEIAFLFDRKEFDELKKTCGSEFCALKLLEKVLSEDDEILSSRENKFNIRNYKLLSYVTLNSTIDNFLNFTSRKFGREFSMQICELTNKIINELQRFEHKLEVKRNIEQYKRDIQQFYLQLNRATECRDDSTVLFIEKDLLKFTEALSIILCIRSFSIKTILGFNQESEELTSKDSFCNVNMTIFVDNKLFHFDADRVQATLKQVEENFSRFYGIEPGVHIDIETGKITICGFRLLAAIFEECCNMVMKSEIVPKKIFPSHSIPRAKKYEPTVCAGYIRTQIPSKVVYTIDPGSNGFRRNVSESIKTTTSNSNKRLPLEEVLLSPVIGILDTVESKIAKVEDDVKLESCGNTPLLKAIEPPKLVCSRTRTSRAPRKLSPIPLKHTGRSRFKIEKVEPKKLETPPNTPISTSQNCTPTNKSNI